MENLTVLTLPGSVELSPLQKFCREKIIPEKQGSPQVDLWERTHPCLTT